MNVLLRNLTRQTSHRFTYGQGGFMNLNLSQRSYMLKVETVWEDYCQLEWDNQKEGINLTMTENGNQAIVSDTLMDSRPTQYVEMSLKVPQYFTLGGLIRGSMKHVLTSKVSTQIRAMNTHLTFIGGPQVLEWGKLRTQEFHLRNEQGVSDFQGLELIRGSLESRELKVKKLMLSEEVTFKARKINFNSLITHGPISKAIVSADHIQMGSMSGVLVATGKNITIGRLYAKGDTIDIDAEESASILVEEGTGIIRCQVGKEGLNQVKLGTRHTGKLIQEGQNIRITTK